MKKTEMLHGGDVSFISQKYNVPKTDLIDFSSNINPLGSPAFIHDKFMSYYDLINVYPDVRYTELKNSIANYTDTTSNILVGNGATEIISAYIQAISPTVAINIVPSYSEYDKELINNNCTIIPFYLEEQDDFRLLPHKLINSISANTDLIIICNPNNPTGHYLPIPELRLILDYCLSRNIQVLVDETYIEFSSNESAISICDLYDNLFVVRGTSKFFGLSGLRLGYGICNDFNLYTDISNKINPWSVNAIAERVGIDLFDDKHFIKSTKQLIIDEYNYVHNTLGTQEYITMYESSANYIMFRINTNHTSTQLFDYLITHNIIIRDLSSFACLSDKYFRFCLLTHNDNVQLVQLIQQFFTA